MPPPARLALLLLAVAAGPALSLAALHPPAAASLAVQGGAPLAAGTPLGDAAPALTAAALGAASASVTLWGSGPSPARAPRLALPDAAAAAALDAASAGGASLRLEGPPAAVQAALRLVRVAAPPDAPGAAPRGRVLFRGAAEGVAAVTVALPVEAACGAQGGAPALEAARMAAPAEGYLLFDRAVRLNGSEAREAACDALLAGAGAARLGDGAACWLDGRRVRFSLGAGAALAPGDALGVAAGAVAACGAPAAEQTEPVEAEAEAAAAGAFRPRVALAAPMQAVPACAAAAGARLWASVDGEAGAALALSATGAALADAERAPEDGVPLALDASGWAAGAEVRLEAAATGAWDATRPGTAEIVMRRTEAPVPVAIAGASRRSHARDAALLLRAASDRAAAEAAGCAADDAAVSFSWSVTPAVDGLEGAATAALRVPPGALDGGVTYTFRVEAASSAAPSVPAVATVEVEVPHAALRVAFAEAGAGLVAASGVEVPLHAARNAAAAGAAFEWSCAVPDDAGAACDGVTLPPDGDAAASFEAAAARFDTPGLYDVTVRAVPAAAGPAAASATVRVSAVPAALLAGDASAAGVAVRPSGTASRAERAAASAFVARGTGAAAGASVAVTAVGGEPADAVAAVSGASVPAASLRAGLEYEAEPQVAQGAAAAVSAPFSVPSAPASSGSVRVSPATGQALATLFDVSAAGFARARDAPDDAALVYQFFVDAGAGAYALGPASRVPFLGGVRLPEPRGAAAEVTVSVRVAHGSDGQAARAASAEAAVTVTDAADDAATRDSLAALAEAAAARAAQGGGSAALAAELAAVTGAGSALLLRRERAALRADLLAVVDANAEALLPATGLLDLALACVRMLELPPRNEVDMPPADMTLAVRVARVALDDAEADAEAQVSVATSAAVSRLVELLERVFASADRLRSDGIEGKLGGGGAVALALSDDDEAERLAAVNAALQLSREVAVNLVASLDAELEAGGDGDAPPQVVLPAGVSEDGRAVFAARLEAVGGGAEARTEVYPPGAAAADASAEVAWPAQEAGAASAVRQATFFLSNVLNDEVEGRTASSADASAEGSDVAIRTSLVELATHGAGLAAGARVGVRLALQTGSLDFFDNESDRISVECVRWDAAAGTFVEDADAVSTASFDATHVECLVAAPEPGASGAVLVAAEVVVRPATPPSSASLPDYGIAILAVVGVLLLALGSVVSFKLCRYQTHITRSQTVKASRRSFHSLASQTDLRRASAGAEAGVGADHGHRVQAEEP